MMGLGAAAAAAAAAAAGSGGQTGWQQQGESSGKRSFMKAALI
jgi:hypothetical protein